MHPNKAAGIAAVLESVKKLRDSRESARPPVLDSANPWKTRIIRITPELERIAGIPRRQWEPEGEAIADELTELLRRPGGTQRLFPIQAYLFRELFCYRGAVGIIRVGGGKSLITFLAPYIMKSFRPLLLVPGSLIDKTKRHMLKDSEHWEIPNFIRVESYEKLGNPNNQDLLYKYKPDLVMLDEGTKVKNTRAVVTKNIGYYIKDCRRGYYKELVDGKVVKAPINVDPAVLVLSGTLTVRSVKDYWHVLRWTLGESMTPLPNVFSELEQWSLALDAKIGKMHRVKPGALLEFCDSEELVIAKTDPLKAARMGYRRRLLETPGIVSTSTPFLGCSLIVQVAKVKPPLVIVEAFKKLRKKWTTPDGLDIEDAHIAAARARQISLGFYYKPDPMPPPEYVDAKKEWSRTCRRIIFGNRRRLDSEGQVIQAMLEDGLYPEALEIFQEWDEWKRGFKFETKAVWLSDYAIDFAAKWMSRRENKRGIVWCTEKAFGERLSAKTKVSYYRENSLDKNGRYIEDHPHNTPMIASVRANYEGKNLQYGWSDNLLMGTIGGGEVAEQWLGRTHRLNQPMDTVTATLFWSCIEHAKAIWSAIEDSEFAEDMESARKLMYADVLVPPLESLKTNHGVLWEEGDIGEDISQ